jgi:hypothetical protein
LSPRFGLTNIIETPLTIQFVSLNISYSGGPATLQPQKSPARGPIFGAPRLVSPIHGFDFKVQYHPFLINKADNITVQKKGKEPLVFEIFLAPENALVRKVVNGKHIPDPWLHLLRIGKNPGEKYLSEIKRKIMSPNYSGRKLNIATKEFPVRWASGGGLVIIRDNNGNKVIPLSFRDSGAIHGGELDAQGGLSSSINDWLHPDELALREISEELIFIISGKKIEPVLFKDITPDDKKVIIKVNFNNFHSQTEGLGFIDPVTGSLDLRWIYEYRISSIKDFIIIDGERDGAKTNGGREILLFKPEDLLETVKGKIKELQPVKSFKNGKNFLPQSVRIKNIEDIFTPVLVGMLGVL